MRLPLAVAVVAALFVIAGVFDCAQVVHPDGWWPAGLGVLALLCAVYLLRGVNWARYLALAWMAFHVGLAYFAAPGMLLIHLLIFAAIGYLLFRRDTGAYFRPAAARESAG